MGGEEEAAAVTRVAQHIVDCAEGLAAVLGQLHEEQQRAARGGELPSMRRAVLAALATLDAPQWDVPPMFRGR